VPEDSTGFGPIRKIGDGGLTAAPGCARLPSRHTFWIWKLSFSAPTASAAARVILENLGWAFAYHLVAVPLAVAGLISPVLAALAMATSRLLVVGDSLRLANSTVQGPPAGQTDPRCQVMQRALGPFMRQVVVKSSNPPATFLSISRPSPKATQRVRHAFCSIMDWVFIIRMMGACWGRAYTVRPWKHGMQ